METGANVPLYGPYSKKYLGLSKIVPRAVSYTHLTLPTIA